MSITDCSFFKLKSLVAPNSTPHQWITYLNSSETYSTPNPDLSPIKIKEWFPLVIQPSSTKKKAFRAYKELINLAATKIQTWFKQRKLLHEQNKRSQAVAKALMDKPFQEIYLATKTLQAFFKTHLIRKALTESRQKAAQTLEAARSLKDDSLIEDGYGEFMIVQKTDDGFASPTFEMYQQALPILQKHRSVSWVYDLTHESFDDRLSSLKQELQTVTPSLEVSFIPRVLCELTFVQALIEETIDEINHTSSGSSLNPEDFPITTALKALEKEKAAGDFSAESIHFVKIAYQINTLFQIYLNECLYPQVNLTYGQMKTLIKQRCDFFIDLAKPTSLSTRILERTDIEALYKFKNKGDYAFDFPNATPLVETALSLECLPGHIVLYRGSLFDFDFPVRDNAIHSLSYGAGLFSGCIYDPGATAWAYMRDNSLSSSDSQWNKHCLILDFKTLRSGVFSIPNEPALFNILNEGEFFHPRTTIPLKNSRSISGISSFTDSDTLPHTLQSPLEEAALIRKFQVIKASSIPLGDEPK